MENDVGILFFNIEEESNLLEEFVEKVFLVFILIRKIFGYGFFIK